MKRELKNKLHDIANEIISIVEVKDDAYGSSWKSRGGFSAFFQLDRKYSRLEQMATASKYDIFTAMLDYEDGPDTLKDLIAYGLLILSETYIPGSDGEPGQAYVNQGGEGVDVKDRHVKLHRAVDELFACYITEHPDQTEFLKMELGDFIEWSANMTLNPTCGGKHR